MFSSDFKVKKSRIIAAVLHKQVEILKELLDSPKCYRVRDKDGYNLLQLAILQNKIEVFDYLLSIPDFPVDFVNEKGQTALVFALNRSCPYDLSEHFSYELIKKGACIDKVCSKGNTLLHFAIDSCWYKTAKLLIQRGADMTI
ncbi:poly [ADP-ribose] polymerase tankyrase-like isoform X3 [Zophobas morio]|uniref:poly [ADP-ribose] polymerase tankyrase-like isoform X3 n=1 Tax=Zophobas morio TaxID=2755281 RepID=UPI003083C16A